MNTYLEFDRILASELQLKICADDIVNRSNYCTRIILDYIDKDDFTINDYLSGLKRKSGLYHLWIECPDPYEYKEHEHRMLCVYVGKGEALGRVKEHIEEKWNDTETIYVSFYECENRISKYLEQLFLDTYAFHLNTNEKRGTVMLYGYWDDDRFSFGTELYNYADIHDNKHNRSPKK